PSRELCALGPVLLQDVRDDDAARMLVLDAFGPRLVLLPLVQIPTRPALPEGVIEMVRGFVDQGAQRFDLQVERDRRGHVWLAEPGVDSNDGGRDVVPAEDPRPEDARNDLTAETAGERVTDSWLLLGVSAVDAQPHLREAVERPPREAIEHLPDVLFM